MEFRLLQKKYFKLYQITYLEECLLAKVVQFEWIDVCSQALQLLKHKIVQALTFESSKLVHDISCLVLMLTISYFVFRFNSISCFLFRFNSLLVVWLSCTLCYNIVCFPCLPLQRGALLYLLRVLSLGSRFNPTFASFFHYHFLFFPFFQEEMPNGIFILLLLLVIMSPIDLF